MVSLFAMLLSRTLSTISFISTSLVLLAITILLVLLVIIGWCNHFVAIIDFIVALCVLLSAKKD